MSTTGIGSSVPGFDVLFPSGVPSPTSVSATNATPATVANSTASTSSSSTTPSTAAPTNSDGLNQYQQAVATLDQWQAQIFQESVAGDTSGATSALYASAGLNADQFANLAAQLQTLESSGTTGSNINTTA